MALIAAQGVTTPNIVASAANAAFGKANMAQLKPKIDAAEPNYHSRFRPNSGRRHLARWFARLHMFERKRWLVLGALVPL